MGDYVINVNKGISDVKERLVKRYIDERYNELVEQYYIKKYQPNEIEISSTINVNARGNDIKIDVISKLLANNKNHHTQELDFVVSYKDIVAFMLLKLLDGK